jgi:site-specific DNA-methyltransferase (adenine-specific)
MALKSLQKLTTKGFLFVNYKTWLDGRIKLYNGDCLEFMENMQEKVDLVLTDPPYLYNDYSAGNDGFDEKEKNIKFIKTISNNFDIQATFLKFNKISKFFNLYCFCSVKQLPEILNWGFENKLQTNLLTWKKGGRPFGITYLHDVEYIIHIKKSGATFNGAYTSRVLEYTSKRIHGHPTEKPLSLVSKLALFGTNENDLVFDGFSGSGTTAISCIKTNRRFIGCELDKEYFNLACNRIDTELKQGNLF